MSGASVVNSALRSCAAGTDPIGAPAVAVSVTVAVGADAIVGRIGITAAGLNGRAVGSRSSGSSTAAGPVSAVSATATGCATATGVAPIAVPKPATTRTAASAHPVTAVRPMRTLLARASPRASAPRC